MPICANCDWWSQAQIVSRGDKGTVTYRKCPALRKRVQSQEKSCKYFNPIYFHCDKNNCRLTFDQCLARRRNTKNLIGYQNCKKCRQFDKEVREIVEEFFIDMVPIVTPRHLARGIATENVEVGSGKIKRRKKKEDTNPNGKRKIKRREKPQSNGKRRKIKRRSKSKAPDSNGLTYTVCPKCGQTSMRDAYCRVCAFKITNKPKRKIKRRSK